MALRTKTIASLLLTIFTYTSAPGLAGDEILNGGDVVVCPREVRTLDTVERQLLHKFPDHTSERVLRTVRSVRLEDAIGDVLEPLKSVHRKLHQCLTSYYENRHFWQEVTFVDGSIFANVPDEVSYVVPKHCEKKQAALQFHEALYENKHRYLFDIEIWNQMDDFEKSVLIIHEILLRNSILNRTWNGDTRKVRHLTGLITSGQIELISSSQLEKTLKSYNFSCKPYSQ